MIVDYGYLDIIHEDLSEWLGNEISVSALMGNFYAESKCTPNRRQGDNSGAVTEMSLSYTAKVDDGRITKSGFIHDSIGYGLAQWTYYTRKNKLYEIEPLADSSIGNVHRQLKLVHLELGSSSSAMNYLRSATDINECSDWICDNYERPAVSNYKDRRNYSQQIYNMYADEDVYYVTMELEGSGNVSVTPTRGKTGTEVTLFAIPDDNEQFVTYEIISGIDNLEYPLTESRNKFIIKDENVRLKAVFTGIPPIPPIPPTPVVVEEVSRKRMPIWEYPVFWR